MFSNNSESLILGQLGANSSLRFLGPPHGVLPIGPNGFRGLGTLPPPPLISTLQPSRLSDAQTNAAILSYNYTLDHQGFSSSISCIYDTQSPIIFSAVINNTFLVGAQGFCNETGLTYVLNTPLDSMDGQTALMIDDDQTLASYACKSLPTGEQDPTYYIYLRGHGHIYENAIGNITCTVSPIQPTIFPVTYQSGTGVFSAQEPTTISKAPHNISMVFVEEAVWVFGLAVLQAQTPILNLLADSVYVFGVKAMGIGPWDWQNKQYLPLYEAMIQGILVDEVCTASNSSCPFNLLMVVSQLTYIRFLYATAPASIFPSPPPASCNRTVTGVLSAEVTGWVAKPVHIGFLMPMTILNLISLTIVLICMARVKRGCHEFDFTDPRSLVSAESIPDESDQSGWADGVLYRSREVRECLI